MTSPEVVAAAITEFHDSPQANDHIWRLTPGVVTAGGAVSVMVQLDGEGFQGGKATPIPVISLIGPLFIDQRVMTMKVPPAGNYVIARIFADTVSEWISYDPVFSSSGVAPSVGAGSTVGRWRVVGPKTIQVEVKTTFGAGMSQGTGTYFWSTPFTASADSLSMSVGPAYILDAGTSERPGSVQLFTADLYYCTAAPTSTLGAGAPVAWASGDIFKFSIFHEIVSFF